MKIKLNKSDADINAYAKEKKVDLEAVDLERLIDVVYRGDFEENTPENRFSCKLSFLNLAIHEALTQEKSSYRGYHDTSISSIPGSVLFPITARMFQKYVEMEDHVISEYVLMNVKKKIIRSPSDFTESFELIDSFQVAKVLIRELAREEDYKLKREIYLSDLDGEFEMTRLHLLKKYNKTNYTIRSPESLHDKKEAIAFVNFVTRPFVTVEEIKNIAESSREYNLPSTVEMKASIGYDPYSDSLSRLQGLIDLKKNNGRDKNQKWTDKTMKNIDENVIYTLRSVVEHDPSSYVVESANKLIRLYEMIRSFKV
ncbi:hypothetical protein HOK51_00010 [Candidatus Woesearchaeota archaeon]|nr:hypothetical protein [Candidatus Woesearchaeota archaeon]MBT6518195.1 hypothetical protein [Candidatus Woesearchaeota archaeon]MBT7368536.1 hypothetical protein [Candidatus Woesearchaeota archaeon]